MAETVTIVLRTSAEGSGVQATVQGLNQVQAAAANLDQFLQRSIKSLASFALGAVGVTAIAGALRNAVQSGVRFNATMENARLGIAAILRQFNPTTFKTFESALGAAGSAIELLRKKAVESPATFEQLVSGFQAITGAATSAGMNLKQQVDLVVLMSQALAGLGIRPEQLIQESRALLTGNINEDALAARILGITRAQIEQARQQGNLFEFLTGKLQSFAEAGQLGAQNYTVALSNLGDVMQQKLAAITLPIFDSLRNGFLALTEALKSADLEGTFLRIGDRVAWLLDRLFDLATFGVRHINALTHAVELLAAAFALLALRATASLIPSMTRLFGLGGAGGIVGTFAAVNKVVAEVSKYSGVFAGIVASLSTFTGAFSILISGLAGFKVGQIIGEWKLFGETINDSVTYQILKAMEAWEKFKISLGMGSANSLAGIQQSIQEMLLPPRQSASAPTDVPELQGESAKPVDRETQLRLQLGQNAVQRDLLEQDVVLTEEEKNQRLIKVLQDRAAILQKLRNELNSQHTDNPAGVPEGVMTEEGIRFTEKYQKVATELNQTLTEQAKIEAEIWRIRQTEMNRTIDGVQRGMMLMKDTVQSMFGEISRGIRQLTTEFDDLGAAVGNVLVNGIGRAIDTVSYGLWQVIDGTATWGDLFRQVGREIISGLIRIAIQEILLDNLKRGIMLAWKAFQSLMRGADLAEHTATEAAKTPSLAANATLASIESYGIAAAIGVAAIAAVLASIGAFQEGGVVRGGRQLIQVNEAGVEAVLNARATAMLGEGTINDLNAGRMGTIEALGARAAAASESSSSRERSKSQVSNILLVDSRNAQAARDFMVSSEGKAVVAEVMRDMRLEVGYR